MRLIDLSPAVEPTRPHWPGDQGFERSARWSIAAGDSVNVDTVTTSAHIGAHIDAPAHVEQGGAAIEAIALDACIGPCLVLDVSDEVDRASSPHGAVPARTLRSRITGLGTSGAVERLLLRHRETAISHWDADTPGLDPEFVRWFGEQGGRLIGLDLDSFDPERSSALPAHRAAVVAGIVMLEGLDLSAAPEGTAEILAAPVHWCGADAAPVRAVLRVAE